MHNLDEITRIYFSCVPVQEILNGNISYKEFPGDEFKRISRAYLTYYSDTENSKLYEYIEESNRTEGHPCAGLADRSGLNVFAALEELAAQILVMEEDEVVCRYPELLRFRDVTNDIEEDLLVCAYLVARARRYREAGKHYYFGWDTVIRHNNVQLRGILREGISENHFHLYGSAPAFQMAWLDLMNHLPDTKMSRELRELGKRPRTSRNHYYTDYHEEGYERAVLKAALIRIFLFTRLLAEEFPGDWKTLSEQKIKALMKNEERIEDYRLEIQNMIDFMKSFFCLLRGRTAIDYALYQVESGLDNSPSGNIYFSGEHWFMFQMLQREVGGEMDNSDYFQWFYAYLVIKNNLRNEILQTNNMVGFENFRIYTKRKSLYTDSAKMAETAVYSSLLTDYLRSLEIRVNPAARAEDNAKMIADYEKLFAEGKRGKTKIYYVFHFAKEEDKFCEEVKKARNLSELERKETVYRAEHCCRHYDYRIRLNRKANEIRRFREQYPKMAGKVLGIDACSQEIGCRPEVFASVFRFLADHVVCSPANERAGQLKMTYHVGEDFLDVIDGLRAVDEAVHFLNLQCGDRIGHGTVLGIDVHKWYEFKSHTIVLPQQDYLDNVAWMYHKLTEFRIRGVEGLQHYLAEQFDIYFSKIYKANLPENQINDTIHSYYEAWKLRGDEPSLYNEGGFNQYEHNINRSYLINYQYPRAFDSRYRMEVSRLYYLYHYNYGVKEEGMKPVEVYVPPGYIEGACELQKAMQRFIASCGIGVETNPSSNLLISTMGSYDEHPIVQLYNKDLTYDNEKLKTCPQVNVSINTDDKGVFRTSLENEYALMACALEKVRDGCGNAVYNRQMIYHWLDNIREMGNMQSFYRDDKDEEIKNGFDS